MPSLPPLADLHRHLDGSVRPSTLEELAAQHGQVVPGDLKFFKGMGLDAALATFAFTVGLLQRPQTVRRVAAEICEDALADGVDALEIRFAPQLHQGAPIAEIVDAALEGIAGRAGLILCGLYGEDPAILDGHVTLAAQRPGVVGIDLAGGPIDSHRFHLQDYSKPFGRAAKLGLGRTVHAAEGRLPGEIALAITELHAQRIGHGTTVLDDPEVADLVIEKQVTIEACPTSNMHVGVIDSVEAHPLNKWLDAGIRVCVNTDNTLLSAVTSREEHLRVLKIPGINWHKLHSLIGHGHAALFNPR